MGMAMTKATPQRFISGLRPIQSANIPAKSVEKTPPSIMAATMTESSAVVPWKVAAR
jgi:hypothetical protein